MAIVESGVRSQPALCRVGSLLGITLLLLACAPAESPPTRPAEAVPAAPAASPAPRVLKTLTLAHNDVIPSVTSYGRPRTNPLGSNQFERWLLFHANLTTFDLLGNVVPQVAEKVPSLQNGEWNVNPDGTMSVTWHLKPNAVWHDGTPLTAEDYAFGFQVVMDPRLPVAELGEVTNLSQVRALDSRTVVMDWKTVNIIGNTNGPLGTPALPRHLLGELYLSGDMVAFDNSPVWTSDWVGLGPYRLSQWEEGSFVGGEAFDHYVMGRPKVDRIILKTVPDINIVMANLLAGTLDVALIGAQLKPEQISELQRTWSDKGQAYTTSNTIRVMKMQFRDPSAPWARDRRFRQAMIYSSNRQEWIDALQYGLAEYNHYLVPSTDPVHRLAEQRGVITYPYDPARAQQLFAEAGWTKGADGLLRNSAGETVPFRCCRAAGHPDSNDVRESLAVVDALQRAGLQAAHPIPSAPPGLSAADIRKFNALNFEGNIGLVRLDERISFASLISQKIANEENRWTGGDNTGGWINAEYDGLYAQLMRTLDPAPRQDLALQLVRIAAEEVPGIALYYNPIGIAVRNGVEGINQKPHAPPLLPYTPWNVHTWDLKS